MNADIIRIRCEELLAEAEMDLLEFGSDLQVAIWFIMVEGIPAITNYDFINRESPITFDKLMKGESITKGSLGDLVTILRKQNKGYFR